MENSQKVKATNVACDAVHRGMDYKCVWMLMVKTPIRIHPSILPVLITLTLLVHFLYLPLYAPPDKNGPPKVLFNFKP